MDIAVPVLRRSARMGLGYVILGLALAVILTASLDFGASVSSSAAAQSAVDVQGSLAYSIVPFGAIAGLLVTTPVYMLFVFDKNAGVLEYLLAVGMTQREVFAGYLKAAFMLSAAGILPVFVLNLAIAPAGLSTAAVTGALVVITGLADVALVTVLMTAFSSMQRKPTGMNSPLGISLGIFAVLPELFVGFVLGSTVVWLDLAVAMALLATSLGLLASLDRLIKREKLLP